MDPPPRNRDQPDEETGLGPDAQRRQRSSIPSFIFVSFLFFMLTNHNEEDALARYQYKDAVQSLEYQMSNFSAWLNGSDSNFFLPTRVPSLNPLIETFVSFGSELDPSIGSYYSNVSALFRGDLSFHNLSLVSENTNVTWHTIAHDFMDGTNSTTIPEHLGTWNWENTKKISIKTHDRNVLPLVNVTENIAILQGRIELFDPDLTETIVLDFDGVHFVENGSFYAFAEQDGVPPDIRHTLSLVPEQLQNQTARVLEAELSRRLSKFKNIVDFSLIDELTHKDDSKQSPKCPFILYGQLEPTSVPKYFMEELEQETEKPTGITTVVPPTLSIRGVLISRECGILYKMSGTKGIKTWTFNRRITTYAGASAVFYLILLVLLSRQISRSRTPAGVSRLSQWTFLAQGLVDTISFIVLIMLAAMVEGRASLSLVAPAALACVLFVYEMQFAVLIYRIQLPEENAINASTPATTAEPVRSSTSSDAAENNTSESTATSTVMSLPTPAAASAPSPQGESFWRFFLHHVRTDPQARLWVSMLIFLVIIFRVIMVFSLPLLSMMVVYSLFWLPQILRSVQRGRSSALSKEYIFGTTICRLCFAFYFLAYPDNILDVEPRPWIFTFACWMFFQVIVIVLQDFYGPAFFLPFQFTTTKVYDYHPVMSVPDSESLERSLGDCSICMDAIVVESQSHATEKNHTGHGRGGGEGFFSIVQRGVVGAAAARKSYSLAPCHHLFHTACLERWLAIKNICPQCRRPLPPL